MRSIEIEDLLKFSNVNGEVYTCDVSRWLEISVPFQDALKISKKLTKFRGEQCLKLPILQDGVKK